MHLPCFPIGQQGLRIFSLSTDPQGLGMAKADIPVLPRALVIKGRARRGQNLPVLLFSDPLDGLITLILKAAKLTFLRNTQLIAPQF